MHHTPGMAAADVMRELRRRGFTQVELARRAGVARETLSRWESGVQRPSIEDLERVVAATGGVLELRIMPAEEVRARIRDVGRRVVGEHAEALRILADHDPNSGPPTP